jgi:glycosyltransferase involved in cell wall biosynthesis
MKVRELIEGTTWRPGRGYDRALPDVTVLLPTYRRGANGFFLRAARSVLDQSLTRLELLIIDDASTDGTAAQIRELMARDDRVSCLTHRRNIGLPAISIYEGYRRARAPYLSFAFDDFIFETNALERLVAEATRARAPILHGYARMAVRTGSCTTIGRRGKDFHDYEPLRQINCLPNAGVMLRKDLVDAIGWFDPHVCLLRVCDQDYWERIRRRHLIEYTPIRVGTEFGQTLDDSLGSSNPMNLDAVLEFMRYERNHLLMPGTFLDRDVCECPDEASDNLKRFIGSMRELRTNRLGAPPEPRSRPTSGREDNRRLVVIGPVEASLSLHFDGIFEDQRHLVTMFSPFGRVSLDVELIIGATAVIFSSGLFIYRYFMELLRLCEALRIPVYYLIDDNWFVIQQELNHPSLKGFSRRSTIDVIRRLAGLIVTSEPLREYARERALNDSVLLLQPVLDSHLRPTVEQPPRGSLTIAVPGGPFRNAHFRKVIAPGLNGLPADIALELLVRDADKRLRRVVEPRIQITSAGFFRSFSEFVRRWRRFGPDVLVHPRGQTLNIDYKSPNAILVAHLLGAVPVVADERAYAALGEEQGVVKVRVDTAEAWRDAVASLVDPDRWQRLRSRLAAYCEARFGPQHNEATLRGVLDRHAVCDATLRARRLQMYANLPRLRDQVAWRARPARWLRQRWYGLPPALRRRLHPLVYVLTARLFPGAMLPRL